MQVKDIMTPHVEVIHPNTTLIEAAAKMSQLDVGLLPVCEGQRVVGMISDRDITVRATAKGSDPHMTRVHEVMSPEVLYCLADQDVETAAQMMEMHQIRRVPVLDHNRQLVGIVSLGDLAVETRDQQRAGEALQRVSEPAEPSR
ncbi:MAG TPA: CBS domain-containing protein [Candidatus Binatia bacterium]|jgi:CBS domain-containing protein|nr:CBS domain-containing protein [Candidatus Binatia bacterium]